MSHYRKSALVLLLIAASSICYASRSRVDCEIVVGSVNRQPPDAQKVEECFLASQEEERSSAAAAEKEAAAEQSAKEKAALEWSKRGGVRIGMTPKQVLASNWGEPDHINRTTTANGVTEQWVYSIRSYLYFRNGRLAIIQD